MVSLLVTQLSLAYDIIDVVVIDVVDDVVGAVDDVDVIDDDVVVDDDDVVVDGADDADVQWAICMKHQWCYEQWRCGGQVEMNSFAVG